MQTWQLQTAKAKLSEVIDEAERKGPQMITRRGVETAVIVPIEEWRRLQPASNERLLEALRSAPDGDLPIPPRGSWAMRKPVKL
jgi:antitoxin Phd